jgi:hypothetical protein
MSGVNAEQARIINLKLKEVENLLEGAGVAYRLELQAQTEDGYGGVSYDGSNNQDWDPSWC